MTTYTVILSEAEDKALAAVCADPQDWINNVVHERCRIAGDEIVEAEIKRLWEAGQPIPRDRETLILQAPPPQPRSIP